MKYSVCILAAGKGSRTHLSYNKVFYKIDGKTILEHSLELFLKDNECAQIIVTCSQEEKEIMEQYIEDPRIQLIIGGATRQDSVYEALQAVQNSYVFIHDGARPFLKTEQIEQLKETLKTEQACLLMIPCTDTVKIVENGYVVSTLDRNVLYNAQTPQCFLTSLIKSCHDQAKKEKKLATDDAQLVEWYSNIPVKVVIGDGSNKKITVPSDLE